jgi:hypothetical protein
MRPPPSSQASSQESAGQRKSIHPVSPNTFACPNAVVTSCPGTSVIPYRLAAAGSSAWWLTVLWSVTAMKSRPRRTARAASSGTVIAPSEWTVCVCRSPASQRYPGRDGSERPAGRSPGTGGAGSGSGSHAVGSVGETSARTWYRTPREGTWCRPSITCQVAAASSPGRYPGVAPAAAIVYQFRAPPDQPRNPAGPMQPRSSTAPGRS